MVFVWLAGVICMVDLVCKDYVESHTEELAHKELCNGKIILNKVHNKGMMLNLLDAYPRLVRMVSGVVGIFLGGYFLTVIRSKSRLLDKLGITFMMGGAASNIYDRFVRKYVVDFFSFKTKWKKLNAVVFNIGDMFIFMGCIILIISKSVRRK